MPHDAALAERLSRPSPRYTSYPTAAHFHEGFGATAHRIALQFSNDPLECGCPRPLSLYVHVPFCASLCHYCGCHAVAGARPARAARYLDYLEREADLVAGLVADDRPVVQFHIGGGTPTTLGAEGLERLGAYLRTRFSFAEDAECSLEADPRTLTTEILEAARRAGFSRLSLGVQSFDPVVQRAIGRVQPYEDVARAVEAARRAGFTGLSFDLIYGLPHQTEATWRRTLDQALTLGPDRLSVFGYAHVPWMKKHQQLIDVAALPGPAERYAMLLAAGDACAEVGYRSIGLDHFARPGDPLVRAFEEKTIQRNFQGYSTHAGCDVIGLGVSSISSFERAYAQNEKGLRDYYAALDAGTLPTARGVALSPEDRRRRDAIERIMCDLALDIPAFERKYGLRFGKHFAQALGRLHALEAEGLVDVTSDRIAVTERGRPFIRSVAAAFDAYLATETTAPARPRYSQAV